MEIPIKNSAFLMTGLVFTLCFLMAPVSYCQTDQTFFEKSKIEICSTPTNLSLEQCSNNESTISWQQLANTDNYLVEITGNETQYIETVNAPQIKLTGLASAKKYQIRVAAYCSGTISEFSEPLYFTTDSVVIVLDTIMKKQSIKVKNIINRVQFTDFQYLPEENSFLAIRNCMGTRFEIACWDIGFFKNNEYQTLYKSFSYELYKILKGHDQWVVYSSEALDTIYFFNTKGKLTSRFTYPNKYEWESRMMAYANGNYYLLQIGQSGLYNIVSSEGKWGNIQQEAIGAPNQFIGTKDGLIVKNWKTGSLHLYDYQLALKGTLNLNIQEMLLLNDSLIIGINYNGDKVSLLSTSLDIKWSIVLPENVKEPGSTRFYIRDNCILLLAEGHILYTISYTGIILSINDLNPISYSTFGWLFETMVNNEQFLTYLTYEIINHSYYVIKFVFLENDYSVISSRSKKLPFSPCPYTIFSTEPDKANSIIYLQEDNDLIRISFQLKNNDTDDPQMTVNPTQPDYKQYNVFPNPIKDILNIEGILPPKGFIYDINGRIIKQITSEQVDLSEVIKGIYIISLDNGEHYKIYKR